MRVDRLLPRGARSGAPMRHPAFFDRVRPIVTRDPLAQTLGAADDGVIDFGYVDAVKFAGHSCPTVAGAYLMTARALERLYGRDLPRRGEIRVEVRQPQDQGVAGVVGAVAGYLTGAAGDGGFKGLGGRYARRNLLAWGAAIDGDLRFTRNDTGAAVDASVHAEVVAKPEDLKSLMADALAPDADDAKRREFAAAWQEWVRRIVIDHADDPALVRLADVAPGTRGGPGGGSSLP